MRRGGTINADGFGIAWLVGDLGDRGAARRYRRERPLWSDPSVPDLTASISSGAIVAAVRSATVGMPVTEGACAPFIEGTWMFSHNGAIDRWPSSVAPLADAVPPIDLMTMDAPTDSAFLWVLVRQHLRQGCSAATALARVVGDVLALAPDSRLNLLLHDGQHIAATTVGHALWLHDGKGSVTISSEALDPGDRRWQPIPEHCLLETTADQYSIHNRDQGWI
jgi:glutamine amidotransferase